MCRVQVQLHRSRPVALGALMKTCGRVDIARGADGEEQIALLQRPGDAGQLQRHFPEPDDVRAQIARLAAAAADRIETQILANIEHQAADLAVHFQQFPVQVNQIAAAHPFVEIVHVLRHDQHLSRKAVFQPGQSTVCRVGAYVLLQQLAAARVVELVHELGVAGEALRGGHILDAVVFPQAITGAECLDAGFGGNAGAGKYHNGVKGTVHDEGF